MKRIVLPFFIAAAIAISGCSGNGAEQLFETAKLEELQHNKEHALQLYREIVKKYPDSEFARNAQERVDALQKDQ
jgi:TolA-binding protein